ncbi:hypothetical protein F4825DRAFT_413084, partial [Nemania diffusa]
MQIKLNPATPLLSLCAIQMALLLDLDAYALDLKSFVCVSEKLVISPIYIVFFFASLENICRKRVGMATNFVRSPGQFPSPSMPRPVSNAC